MKPLDDAKFSGTKDVDERLKIDSVNLQPWINEYVPNAGKIKAIEQFKGGQSNPTYKIITESKSLVLRRKPPGKLLPSAHAVDREYKVITALYETGVPVPKTYGLCEDDDVAGTAFFIMDFLDGDLFWDPMIPTMTNRDRTQIYKNKNKTLAKLHSVDYKKIGLEDYGKPGNYVARQVSRWSKQYRASETDNIEAMNNLIDWLPKNIPDDDETTIVHGDYRLDNIIFTDDDKSLAILDWELSTIGDPLADFGYHCMLWDIGNINDDTAKENGIFTQKEYVDLYLSRTNFALDSEWEFYIIFSLFKLAGICQGILGRVRDGTASSDFAKQMGERAKFFAELGWQKARRIT